MPIVPVSQLFTISSESPKTVLKPLMNLNRSSRNHIWGSGFEVHNALQSWTSLVSFRICCRGNSPGLTTITNGSRKVWHSLWPWWETQLLLALNLTIALLWMKESDGIFLIILSTKHRNSHRKVSRWIWKSMKSGTIPDTTSCTKGTIHPFRNDPLWGPFLQGHQYS